MRILLVYGHEPSGHASAAHALETCALDEGLEPVCVNISDYHSILGPAIAKTYLQLIQRWPGLWTALYDNHLVATVAQNWQKLYIGLQGSKLKSKLEEIGPNIIVCTHAPPLAALALEKANVGFDWPLVAVITDFSAHSYWLAPKADLYLVPSKAAYQSLIDRGIDSRRVRDTGIPIHPVFCEPVDKAAARKKLGLPSYAPVILITGGSRGLGQIAGAAKSLLEDIKEATIVVVCGSNQELYDELKTGTEAKSRLSVYGSLSAPRIKELMGACDLLIGKAGGLTIAESLAMGLPMIFLDPIPGQESRNVEFILANGAAAQARNLEELAGLTRSLLAPERLKLMRQKAKNLGRPNSARQALEAMLSICPVH